MAFAVWSSYLQGKQHNRNYNFMCKEFYEMTRDELGNSILGKWSVNCHYPDLVRHSG